MRRSPRHAGLDGEQVLGLEVRVGLEGPERTGVELAQGRESRPAARAGVDGRGAPAEVPHHADAAAPLLERPERRLAPGPRRVGSVVGSARAQLELAHETGAGHAGQRLGRAAPEALAIDAPRGVEDLVVADVAVRERDAGLAAIAERLQRRAPQGQHVVVAVLLGGHGGVCARVVRVDLGPPPVVSAAQLQVGPATPRHRAPAGGAGEDADGAGDVRVAPEPGGGDAELRGDAALGEVAESEQGEVRAGRRIRRAATGTRSSPRSRCWRADRGRRAPAPRGRGAGSGPARRDDRPPLGP